ncbi:cytochrome P450 [Rhodococcus sp. NPDC003318]|uniref:cytochrome P450 n=1 Tax=Rhodococcus sp. NPDC003318 TaxID=3364503 RepID=UPI0036A29906
MVPPKDARPKPVQWLLERTDPGLPDPIAPPSMLRVDPPAHTRYRRLVTKPFNHRAVEKLRERVLTETDRVLVDLAAMPAPELMADFAVKLPVAVIGAILGVPDDVRPRLADWGTSAAPLLDLCPSWPAFRTAISGLEEGAAYFAEHIEALRRAPEDNVLSDLIANGGLDDRELLTNAALLLGAGFETTANLLGNGIVALQSHPEQCELLRADPTLWATAVDEILRFDSPVQVTARVATCDVTVEGQDIDKGTVVLILLGGANHDPAVFPDPDRFDVTRPNAREHLSFGSGIHTCLGANLARMEGTIALRALYDRFSEITLDVVPARRPSVNMHGWAALPAALIEQPTFTY